MKYLFKQEILIDINGDKQFPHLYPVFLMGTEEEIGEIKRSFLKATSLGGFSQDHRRIRVSTGLSSGYLIRELMEKLNDLEEIPEDKFNCYLEIPHWNPLVNLKTYMDTYFEQLTIFEKENNSSANMEDKEKMVKKIIKLIEEELPEGSWEIQTDADT
jgi:hypothetical protein